jgi:hypothetical protein
MDALDAAGTVRLQLEDPPLSLVFGRDATMEAVVEVLSARLPDSKDFSWVSLHFGELTPFSPLDTLADVLGAECLSSPLTVHRIPDAILRPRAERFRMHLRFDPDAWFARGGWL